MIIINKIYVYVQMFSHFLQILVICIFLLFVSCSPQTVCHVIDIDSPTGSVDLRLSDLLDNITYVPLETREDLLLSTANTFIVTDHYIIVFTNERLLQFNRQGNYIKTLATKGNGPNEFINLRSPLVDHKREILYYYPNMGIHKLITCIDLKTGNFLDFKNPDISAFNIETIDAEGSIYGFPMSFPQAPGQKAPDSLLLAYRYNPTDNRTTTFKALHTYTMDDRSKIMFRKGDDICFFYRAYSDTLFKINGSRMIPQCVIKLSNQSIYRHQEGADLDIRAFGNWGTIFTLYKRVQVGNTNNTAKTFVDYLCFNKNGVLGTLNSIIIDYPIGVTGYQKGHSMAGMPAISGAWGYYAREASDMTVFIGDALKGNQLSDIQRKVLIEIAAKMDEDDDLQ